MIKKSLLALAFAGLAFAPAMAQYPTEEEVEIMETHIMIDAPDFTLKNLDGKDVSLSDFKGQWVVLDFWGSWCKWCIKGIPEMKEAYAQYHPLGLEIIGIDCGDSVPVWREAVGRYDLPWVNLYNPEDGDITDVYAIQGFPTKIIINPEGQLYDIVIGEDPEFYEILKKIFF